MNQDPTSRDIMDRANWNKARPQHIPRPTYWPFFLAMGLAFGVWGLLVGWIIGVAGVVMMVISLTGWITELRHETGKTKD